jgi:hypothetical protein
MAIDGQPAPEIQPAPVAAQAAPAPGTPAAAAAAAAQAQQEREREREEQRREDVRLSAVAKRSLAEALQAVAQRKDQDAADVEVGCLRQDCRIGLLRPCVQSGSPVNRGLLIACLPARVLCCTTACPRPLQVFLPLALTAASRMLEPLLTNAESSRVFVEHGGADVLLKLHQLPKLTVRATTRG